MNKKFNNNITPRKDDFAKWYTDIIKQADLCDYGNDNGATKGAIIFRPYSYSIWENIQTILNLEFKKNNIQNVMFPLLITQKTFELEKEHIAGFAPECAIVTKVGDKKLEEVFIIRPTSEVLFCKHFQRIVKSYKHLPLLYNQWCNVIRWEKTTRPFLRNSEFLWQEGHTVHNNEEEAIKLANTMIKLYAKFVEEKLAIKVILGRKTVHERFAGALDTYTIETMMQDGQALQAGTSHYFGQKFAKIFDIKFNSFNNKQEYAFQTSWGVSTRLIGALIMAHSDDLGLVLPGSIAPIQIAILNLMPKDKKVSQLAQNLFIKLKKTGYLVLLNNEDKSASFKKSETEIKGIPLIIEVGKKELEKQVIGIILRYSGEVFNCSIKDNKKLIILIEKLLKLVNQNLLKKSNDIFLSNLKEVTNFKEYQKIIKNHKGYIIAPFCGDYDCEAEIKHLTNTTSRCIPIVTYKKNSKCFKCHKADSPWTYFARSY